MVGVGFDTGGSRTSYAIDRGDGPSSPSGSEAGVSLADARGSASTQAAITWMAEILGDLDDDYIVAWIGAAGFSAATSHAIQEGFKEPLSALSDKLEASGRECRIFIANDAVSILRAPPLLSSGVAAIIGTGSVVMGAHPKCPDGVVKRGGSEWLVSDEGSGVWMTLQCIRQLLADVQARGSQDYHSPLLDRLTDFLAIPVEATLHIPPSHRAMAKIDLIARKVAENRPDTKRFLAGFAYPNIFDLGTLQSGAAHDPIASEVLSDSVRHIAESARVVSDVLSAHTADEPNLRETLPMVIGGNIAANPHYEGLLRAAIASTCRSVSSVEMIGDAADELAALAMEYGRAGPRERAAITQDLDPLHPVLRLM